MPRGVRRLAQPAVADRARDLGPMAARPRRSANPRSSSISPISRTCRPSIRGPGRPHRRVRDRDAADLQSPIDILDEDHSLSSRCGGWRRTLSCATRSAQRGRAYWTREHLRSPAWSRTIGASSRARSPRPAPAADLSAGTCADRRRTGTLRRAAGSQFGVASAFGVDFDDTREWRTVEVAGPAHASARCSPSCTSILAASRSSTISSSSSATATTTTVVSEGDEIEIVNFVGGG